MGIIITDNTLPYPIFMKNGERLDLRTIYTGSTFSFARIVPPWLTLQNNTELVIASDAVTETTPLIVYLDLPLETRRFYLVVEPSVLPSLRISVDELNMLADSTYDLFYLVENAREITFQAGQTQPTGSSMDAGVFTIGTTAGTAYFTATNDAGDFNFQIKINVVQTGVPNLADFSETTRERVEIAGIDVSTDLSEVSGISERVDAVSLNNFQVNDARFTLFSEAGKYNTGIANNFWQTNSLNAGGYQERVNIFKEYFIGGSWVSHVVFSGVILRAEENIEDVTVTFTVVDVASQLRRSEILNLGTLEKWGVLTRDTSTDIENNYNPENSILPIQVDTVRAWSDQTELTVEQTALPSEGPPLANTGQITTSELKTNQRLSAKPLLNFKTQPQAKSLESLANELAIASGNAYQVNFDVESPELSTPYLYNLGNTALNTERTRIAKIPVDWVYDPTHKRILTLLSNPSERIADTLVAYYTERDRYAVLHTFERDVEVRRIARRDDSNYYILASEKGTPDNRSIYHYDTDTDTLTVRVSPTDTLPPRVMVDYPIPEFENDKQLADKGTFKCVGENLYYAYSNFRITTEVGVAELGTSGAPTSLISEFSGSGRFAFDVTDSGVIYLITIRRLSTETTTITVGHRVSSGSRTVTFNLSYSGSPRRVVVETRKLNNFNLSISTDFTVSGTADPNISGAYTAISSITVTVTASSALSWRIDVSLSVPVEPVFANRTKIQRRDTDGTVTEMLDRQSTADDFPFVCSEAIVHSDNLYAIVQTGDPEHAALGHEAILKFDVSGDSITESYTDAILTQWTKITNGAVHLFVYDDAVHFLYNLPLYIVLAFGTVVDHPVDEAGGLRRIEDDGTITSLGNLWRDGDAVYRHAILRPLVIDDDLHFVMGYGNVIGDILATENSPTGTTDASQKDNFQHIVRSSRLRYVLSDAAFTGNIYAALAELALMVDATLSFQQNIIHIRSRRVLKALTDGNTGV